MAESKTTKPTEPVVSGGLGDDASHSRRGSDTSNDHITKQTPETAQKSVTQKIKSARTKSINNVKSNWKWYLLGGLIFLAILLPIVFKVILPAIVQLIVNQQPLPVLGGSFLFQTPDSILCNLNTSFKSPLPASIQPFSLQLYNRATPTFTPWLTMQIGKIKVNGDTQIRVINQMQRITDGEEFTKWFGKVTAGADKTITFKGLNLHRGIRLEHAQLVLPSVNGHNLKGMLMIPNKSPIAFGIGDYTLDVFAAGVNIGYITIKDTVLNPGDNLQALDGFIDLRVLVANVGAIINSMALSLADGMIEVTVTGRECYIHGQRSTLIENVLNHRSLVIHGSIATVAADLVGGLLMPQLNTGHGTNQGSAFIDAISTVFSNQTLMGNIADHWNKTKKKRSE
ncbi:hypothetical protein MY4038_000689 [Beauveria bassiana]